MTEENIRYITNDDIPNVVEPCYITSDGELYQWSIRRNQMMEKAVFYDRSNNTAKVNIMLYDRDTKGRTTKAKTVSVASLVYRYFNGIGFGKKRLDIGHHDHDVMNCHLDNLYLIDIKNISNPRGSYQKNVKDEEGGSEGVESEESVELESTPHSRIYGLQNCPLSLVLSDIDSVMTFLEMKKAHPNAVETKLTIDTTDWTADDLRKLLKIRARLGDTIIK